MLLRHPRQKIWQTTRAEVVENGKALPVWLQSHTNGLPKYAWRGRRVGCKRRADAPATQMPVDEDGEELEYEDEYDGDEFEEEIIAGGEEGEEGEEGMEISASEMLGSDGVHA